MVPFHATGSLPLVMALTGTGRRGSANVAGKERSKSVGST